VEVCRNPSNKCNVEEQKNPRTGETTIEKVIKNLRRKGGRSQKRKSLTGRQMADRGFQNTMREVPSGGLAFGKVHGNAK